MKTQYVRLDDLLLATSLSLAPDQLSLLDQALVFTQEKLQEFAKDPDFGAKIALAFGTGVDADTLKLAWQGGDFSTLPRIEILTADQLNGANGAYSIATNSIYLSIDFLQAYQDNPDAVTGVLLEEIGHFVDSQINNVDSPGDEGAIFSALVYGQDLDPVQLQELKAENDAATIYIGDQTIQVERAGSYTGSNLDELATGLDKFLSTLQDAVSNNVFEKLPLLGDQLKNSNASEVRFIDGIRNSIKNALSQPGATSSSIEQGLTDALGTKGLNILQGTVVKNEDTDNIEFSFTLKTASTEFSSSLGADLGLPGLGLSLNGSATTGIDYNFNLKFGINKTTGFYFDTSALNEIGINLITTLPNFSATGELGFLQLNATDQGSLIDGHFKVDLKDSNNRLDFTELDLLTPANYSSFVDRNLSGSKANLKFGLTTSSGGSIVLPKIKTDLNVDWTDFKLSPTVSFKNVNLDLGTFFSDFTNPVLGKIKKITEPVQPIIDLLTIPIDLKIHQFNLLDIANNFGKTDGTNSIESTYNFINSIKKITKLSNSSPSSSLNIDFGSFDLGTADILDANFDLSQFNNINLTQPNIQPSIQLASSGQEKDFINDLKSLPGGGFQFNILYDPTTKTIPEVFKLLLGQDASLFTYTMPELKLSASYSQFFPVIGPLGAEIKGDIGAGARFSFGYDTNGLSKNISNGFYIVNDGTPQVTLSASLGAYGSIAGIAGVGGDISADIGFRLKDPSPGDQKVRFSEFEDLLNDPNGIFRASGKLTAGLDAYLKIGVGPFSYTKRFESPRVILKEYKDPDEGSSQPQPTLAKDLGNNFLQLNLGPHAAERQQINTVDGDEVFTIEHKSSSSSGETLSVTAFGISQEYKDVLKIFADGGQGNDSITLGAEVKSPIQMEGGVGDDTLSGGQGNDTIIGGDGADILSGGSGWNHLYGGDGNDILNGGDDDDWLSGGAGADTFNGGNGYNIASYSSAQSGISLNLTTGEATGDAAGDVFPSIDQFDQIDGSSYSDTLIGSSQRDVLNGGDGNDFIDGAGEDDNLMPGWGDDVVDGGTGTDRLVIDYSLLPTQAVAWRDYDTNQTLSWDVYVANAYGIGTPIRIDAGEIPSYDISISDNGSTIAWTDSDGLRIKKINTSEPEITIPFTSGYWNASVFMSGDGSKVVWLGNEFSNFRRIWVANTDGTGVKPVTNYYSSVGNIAISADGSTIAWTGNGEVFVANSDGTNLRQITYTEALESWVDLSADGSKVTWEAVGTSSGGVTGVFVANSDGSDIRELSENISSYNNFPAISSDGTRVVWESWTNPNVQTGIYAANSDGPELWRIPYSDNPWAFNKNSLSGDGRRAAFAQYINSGWSLLVANVDRQSPSALIDTRTLIDNGNPYGGSSWDYGGSSGYGPALSTYVNIGVKYNSFDVNTGSGEITTWGPSHVQFNNIERFDITGTRYGDDLLGGNLDDILTGGGGADFLKAGLGDDAYSLNPQTAGGSKIQDTGGNDKLNLEGFTKDPNGNYVKDANGNYSSTTATIALGLAKGTFGLMRDGTTLEIDLNADGIIKTADDLSILDFFDFSAGAGTGFIENVGNLSGTNILNKFSGASVPSLSINDINFIEGNNGTTDATFTVNLSQSSAQIVTVNYVTADGTASSLSDYVAASGTLTFTPGETSKTIVVSINGDTSFETDETLTVNLSGANNATIAQAQGIATITNDDAQIPTVVDNDNDGVPDDLEAIAGDRNQDGILDSNQNNVASFLPLNSTSNIPSDFINLVSPNSTFLTNVTVTNNPAPNAANAPSNINFPIGFLYFSVSNVSIGGTTQVTLLLPQRITANTYWKFDTIQGWSEFLYDGSTGAEFIDSNSDGKTDQIILHFIDGGRGDGDGTPNGQIVDPSAPGITQNVPLNNIATISGTPAASVTEDASTPTLTVTGTLTVNDIDPGENKFSTAVTSAPSNLGTLSITDIGNYTYTVDNSAVQYLGAGQTKTETFTVQSFDGTAKQDITITLNGINDEPTGADNTVTTLIDTPYTFTPSDFGFSDPKDTPANKFLAVKISTLPTKGTLTNKGIAITAGDSIAASDITAGTLQFIPEANTKGLNYASFTFQVQDDGGIANGGIDLDLTPNTLTLDVTPVGSPTLNPAKLDFNGDGKTDVLCRNIVTGENTFALLDGTNVIQFLATQTVADTNWEIGGAADFNDDRNPDVLCRNKLTGENAFAIMDGTNVREFLPAQSGFDSNWTIGGVDDFNNDGKADVLYRNKTTGENAFALMNGTNLLQIVQAQSVPDLNWEIGGVGDFSGDGKPDVLFRNKSTGENAFALMDGTNVREVVQAQPVPDLNWTIGSVGDYNNDGQSDILWRNQRSGENTFTLMNRTALSQIVPTSTVADLNWQIGA
jgi:VCBS repeat-containing protein